MISLYVNDHANWQIPCQPGQLTASLWPEIVVWLQVRELEGELEGEVRRTAEAQRGARRLERCVKELTYQVCQETPFAGLGCALGECAPSA